ncbi:hypothetical protein GGI12_004419 [Dipsacomyces acuminosporus]|nr:hypothetical protein GGI12_004419 [Dipsacomyces acuminosporus]
MKTTIALPIFLASLAAALPNSSKSAKPTPTQAHADPTHHLRTMTDGNGYTLLVDDANAEYGGFIIGKKGVDGIYNVNEQKPHTATETWVDIHDGIKAVIDQEHPNHYTVYNSANSPVQTISYPAPWTSTRGDGYSTSSAPSHYLMTFVNQKSETLLVDQAAKNAGILQVGVDGVDGIYTAPPAGIPAKHTGTDTWVDSADGIIAVVDNQNPNLYTVYDASWNPIETVGPTPTPHRSHHLATFTNDKHHTLLIDYAENNFGVYIEGKDGVDGIYGAGVGVHNKPHETGLATWVDSKDGVKVVLDKANPNAYTAYDFSDNPIETGTLPTPTGYGTEPTHHLRTFTNQKSQAILVDYAVTDVGVLKLNGNGVDGIYHRTDAKPTTGTDTWVNDYDNIKAVIDNQHPNHYTVYDNSNNAPIATISY